MTGYWLPISSSSYPIIIINHCRHHHRLTIIIIIITIIIVWWSYSSSSEKNDCMVQVAAAHMNADSVIHFGHTCLTPSRCFFSQFIFSYFVIFIFIMAPPASKDESFSFKNFLTLSLIYFQDSSCPVHLHTTWPLFILPCWCPVFLASCLACLGCSGKKWRIIQG